MSKMRAVLIKGGQGPVENLYIGETDKPIPTKGQVLVKIVAFGLNRTDLAQRQGKFPVPPGVSSILGLEFSGRVTELGEGVTRWAVGDEVFGLASGGAYAEFINCDEGLLLKKPNHLSWVDAASIPENYITAYQTLVKYGEVKKGDHVLVHAGASGVGIAAIQTARESGSCVLAEYVSHGAHRATITATASTTEKLDWLRSIPNGATHTVNYRTEDFAAEVGKTTNGRGIDIVIDVVGQSHWAKNIQSLAIDGRMIMLAALSGGNLSPQSTLARYFTKRLRIQGSTLRSRSLQYQIYGDLGFRNFIDKVTGANGGGPIRTYIHKVYPWTEIQSAHREMADNKNIGKIVVEIQSVRT
ncbi:quinone oxidoreductase putative [Suillus paluster]|uniref:quinone oxidoreductase putative n=1 Tax=Suillus paluster TaxID=48578 RepID=UPI001B8629E3|nr:quinone oxidoreductase putative [Suillus paluster]KAG1723075.1 quinone oxidoreductase putative [Suillus paluster]